MIVINYVMYCVCIAVAAGTLYFHILFVRDLKKQKDDFKEKSSDLQHMLNDKEEQLDIMRGVLKGACACRDRLTEDLNKLLKEKEETEEKQKVAEESCHFSARKVMELEAEVEELQKESSIKIKDLEQQEARFRRLWYKTLESLDKIEREVHILLSESENEQNSG